jgi:hypothetical protein
MVSPPKQNWSLYEAWTRQHDVDWLRGLSLQDRFAIYEDLFNVIWTARGNSSDWARLDRRSWHQKLAIRLRQVEAFSKLDQLYRERAAANNAG